MPSTFFNSTTFDFMFSQNLVRVKLILLLQLRRALTFCSCILLLSSDHIFFIIEKLFRQVLILQVNKTQTRPFRKVWNGNIFILESLEQLGPLSLIRYQHILPSLYSVASRVVVLHQNVLIEKGFNINYLFQKHAIDLFRKCTYKWPG